MLLQHFLTAKCCFFFRPVTVTEPLCVEFKIKGCSICGQRVCTLDQHAHYRQVNIYSLAWCPRFSHTMASDVVSVPPCSLSMS